MSEKVSKALRLIDLLADLPAPLLAQLAKFSMLRQIRAGETIFCQGEPAPYCFGILSGQIKIQRVPREKEFPPKILSVLGPGSLFGEQALFKESPRTAMAVASQNGELVAIQGKQFRDWIEQDLTAGVPLLMGMLQNTIARLRQTSHELSVVYGVDRFLASDKPIKDRLHETADFLRASLEDVDELIIYQRNPYWEEFEPLVHVGAAAPGAEGSGPAALPITHPLVKQVAAMMRPVVVSDTKDALTALVPLIDSHDSQHPLLGFLWAQSKANSRAFSPNILLLLESVSVQLMEALLRHHRQEDQEAQSRLHQSRQSFSL
jgi:CRP-like cAMP-binding protein